MAIFNSYVKLPGGKATFFQCNPVDPANGFWVSTCFNMFQHVSRDELPLLRENPRWRHCLMPPKKNVASFRRDEESAADVGASGSVGRLSKNGARLEFLHFRLLVSESDESDFCLI